MPDAPPPEFDVRRFADGIAYELPRRPLDGLRGVAVFLVFFGAGLGAAPPVLAFADLLGSSSPDPVAWVFATLSLVFLLAGGLVSLLGLAILRGRAAIVIRSDSFEAVERLGPLRWRRRRRASGLRRVEVRRAAAKVNGRTVVEGPLAELSAMKAEFTDARPLILAAGYPESWLLPIAARLQSDLQALQPGVLIEDRDPIPVEVVRTDETEATHAPVDRPPGSTCTVRENTDGLTVTIPPAGVRKGSKGLFVFSIMWCGFMTVFTALAVAMPLIKGNAAGDIWPFVGFCSLFWAIGAFMMVMAINMGRRHAIIDVVDDALLINRKNLFGLKSHQWTRDQLVSVTVGPSGMEVNEVPVLELKVNPTQGRPVGLFAGRDEAELRWMASLLHRRLFEE